MGDFLTSDLELLEYDTRNAMRRVQVALIVRALGGNAMGTPGFSRDQEKSLMRPVITPRSRLHKGRGIPGAWP